MGFLGRIFGRSQTQARTAATSPAITLHACDLVEVVGESHRQDALRRVAAIATGSGRFVGELSGRARKLADEKADGRWFRAVLICEKSNQFDSNAIAVHADGVGLLGYLGRDDAIDYQPVFRELERRGCRIGTCPAFLIGGEAGKPSYGVLLCLSSPERIISDLEETMPV
jgi:hypothetical protein